MQVTKIGLDLAKTVFTFTALMAVDGWSSGNALTRGKVLALIMNLPACLVGMGACAGAHH